MGDSRDMLKVLAAVHRGRGVALQPPEMPGLPRMEQGALSGSRRCDTRAAYRPRRDFRARASRFRTALMPPALDAVQIACAARLPFFRATLLTHRLNLAGISAPPS